MGVGNMRGVYILEIENSKEVQNWFHCRGVTLRSQVQFNVVRGGGYK